jgi:hypothetical protein
VPSGYRADVTPLPTPLPPARSWMPDPAPDPYPETSPSAQRADTIVWKPAHDAAAEPEPEEEPDAEREVASDSATIAPSGDDYWDTPISYYRAGEDDELEPPAPPERPVASSRDEAAVAERLYARTRVAPEQAGATEVVAPPVEPEFPREGPSPSPPFVERARMRRRARYLRALKEIQLRDIGGFALELYRFSELRPELMAAKLRGASVTDNELRALEHGLDERSTIRELREAGIGGACEHCGAVHGASDRYCATCGEPLGPPPDEPDSHGRS